MTTTILSLPDELLLCIVNADVEQLKWSGRQAPLYWTISHVCHRFRDVVTGAPTLWSEIETQLTSHASCNISDLYIERSTACNLLVTLLHNGANDNTKLASLVSHSNRIQRLTIVAEKGDLGLIRYIIDPFRHAPAASLQCLQIEVKPSYEYKGPLPDMFALGAPLLRSLKLSGFEHIVDTPPPKWAASIVKLDLTQSKSFHHIITAFSSLHHLAVDGSNCSEPIQLPSLTSLCLSLDDDEESTTALAEALDYFTTPALTDLTAQNIHGDIIPALFNTTSLSKSCSALTSLVFVGERPVPCKCGHHEPLYTPKPMPLLPLRTFPALSSLSIIDVCYAANIIRDILGAPVSWSLRTVTICTEIRLQDVENLYEVLKDAVSTARQQEREIPKFRLSSSLFRQPYWQENKVDVELFKEVEIP